MNNDFIEKIYNEHYHLIKAIVKNSIHSQNSDDITACIHDVFLIAMKKEGLDKHISIKGWLIKTAKNVTNDFNKSLNRSYKYCEFDLENADTIPDNFNFADALIEDIEFERMINDKFIDTIKESLLNNERDFFELLYFHKKNVQEISQILHISEGAAAVRQTRLKVKIKNILKNM